MTEIDNLLEKRKSEKNDEIRKKLQFFVDELFRLLHYYYQR